MVGELEQELPLMAPVCDLSDVGWQEYSVGARHGS